MIRGNIEGIRQSALDEMEKLFDTDWARDQFLPDRLLGTLVRYTDQLNREIMVYMSRDGNVLEISVGSNSSVSLPERTLRRSLERLCGIRCIHTHPGGSARLSDVDEQALRLMRFDAMCVIGVKDGIATGITAAFLGEIEYGQLAIHTHGPVKPGRVPQEKWLAEIDAADERVLKTIREGHWEKTQERVMLVGAESEESLDELESLANTAGAIVIQRALQRRQKPDPATFIGSGKVSELSLICQAADIDLVIFDDELTAAQARNIGEILGEGVRVIDRTALILDIFAQRAQSYEGKLQVELAQMKYNLPRLTGMGSVLSRLGGGIGTRGPGETQLEVDRRRIRKRIDDLERELKEIKQRRDLRRVRREKQGQTTVALVGYTNAGKSTLLNALAGSDVLVEDKLFATLDTVMRNVDLPENRSCLLVDTVGFIRKLPHPLVQAFRSTLEEAIYADLLIVVSDLSSPNYKQQRDTVFEVLNDLGATDRPILEVLNKADRVKPDTIVEPADAILISARDGMGLETLKAEIARRIAAMRHRAELVIPYSKGNLLSMIHSSGQVLSEEYLAEGTKVDCLLDMALYQKIVNQLK